MTIEITPEINPATAERLRTQIDDLCEEFRGVFSRETVEEIVKQSLQAMGEVRFDDFLPILVYRFSRDRLRATGQAAGSIVKDVPEVLFVCVHNAGRSQMAAALLNHRAQGRAHVRSAGSAPAGEINPAVVAAMQELGIDVSEEFPKPLTDEVVRAADAVVTMGCGDACPYIPGKRYVDWDLEEPSGKPLEQVRAIRAQIADRVAGLVRELDAGP